MAHRTALAAETNDAMIPSPVCFTSRPPNADNASRTIVSCTPRIASAASSPSDCVNVVEFTTSVNSTVESRGRAHWLRHRAAELLPLGSFQCRRGTLLLHPVLPQ